jgi:glycosyltransferase involved in cell wall biosynthesis
MRVLLINSVCGIGSTGKICGCLAEEYAAQGNEVKIAYGRDGYVPERFQKFAHRIGSDLDVRVSALRTRLLDDHGFANEAATRKFLKWAESYDPDLLWLHNLHGYYIHVGLLFDWIKSRPHMQVKWTLHDCWVFTGHCSHFAHAKCEKWKTGCSDCPEKGSYPASAVLDNSRKNFLRKQAAFTGVRNMTLIVPSRWLENLVNQSFLGVYPVEVCNTTIDTNIFKPTPGDFREKHGLTDKKIILGVAGVWTDRKGLGDFRKLRGLLDDSYAIVLVGLTEQQIGKLPQGILGITRTHDARELARIYSAADVFVNPSREETFGLTTLEAISCGTPAIVYRGTACEEVAENYGGITVEPDPRAVAAALPV